MDTLSTLVNRLKNAASAARAGLVVIPYSALSEAALQALRRAGFVESVLVQGEGVERTLSVTLARENGTPRLSAIARVSKPGRRLYRAATEVKRVRRGAGALIVSTSKGVFTDTEARKEGVGGEPLFVAW
jgi:small subunit ribosomal protein S8